MGDSGKSAGLTLKDDFGTAGLKAPSLRVKVSSGGAIVHIYIDSPVQVHHAANDDQAAASADPQIGDKMPAGHPNAGWIYAGISRTTHEPFYVAPKDSGVFQWKEAMAFAAKEGSRVPSREELDQIYDAREKGALKGTFNVTGSYPAGWYWSSSQFSNFDAWAQRFSDGSQDHYGKINDSSLRCVR